MTTPQLDWLNEFALILCWPAQVDAQVNAQVHAVAARLERAQWPGVDECVPAYASLAVLLDRQACLSDPGLKRRLRRQIRDLAQAAADATPTEARLIELDVCYGGEHGPDLAELSTELGISADELIRRHSAVEYRVALLGFAPGFPYLLGLDPSLHAPRLAQPRTRVPAGSVGIAGGQTGVYPSDGPGGWRLIGRTAERLFDPHATPPTRLAPGDRLRFRPIDADGFAGQQYAS